MTVLSEPGTQSGVARIKDFPVRIVLPMDERMADRITASLVEGEPRVHFIREAIDRELKRRERLKNKEPKP